ncbi:MAG: peptidase [Acidobacteria bacterium]|nr:peptidase [Acidobacteriota bacterium]
MTYCLGIQVEEGLIGIADTRILSGNEVRVAKKTWVRQGDGYSMFVMTSGLRSTRDKVLMNFEELLDERPSGFDRLFKAVNAFATEIRKAAAEDRELLEAAGLRFNLHALIGGQCSADKAHKLYLVYPEGNWVEVGEETPYEIIGASGYGKPVLARSLQFNDSLQFAFRLGCLSFDSSKVCAADVDYPVDVLLYKRDSYRIIEHRYSQEDLKEITNWWSERLKKSVREMPSAPIDRAFAKLETAAAPQPE